MCSLHKLTWVLVLIGALNWGLIGIFNLNLVHAIVGAWPPVERVTYVLVGLAALAMFGAGMCKMCKQCEMKK